MEILNEFASWSMLATIGGATAGAGLLTQAVKNAKGINKLSPQLIGFIWALIILYAANYFTGALTPDTAALIPFNAVIVSFAASGGYDALKSAGGKEDA